MKNGKVSRVVVDSLFSTWYQDKLLIPGQTVSHGFRKRDSSFGVVLAGEVKMLAQCFNEHMRYHGDVVADTEKILRGRNVSNLRPH